MLRALDEYRIEPLTTLIPFHKAILSTEQWAKGETCRDLTEDKKWLEGAGARGAEGAERRRTTSRTRPRRSTRSRSTAGSTR